MGISKENFYVDIRLKGLSKIVALCPISYWLLFCFEILADCHRITCTFVQNTTGKSCLHMSCEGHSMFAANFNDVKFYA